MKRQSNTKSGPECGPIKKWKLEEELCFLLPQLNDRPSPSTLSDQEQDDCCCDCEKCQEYNITVPITLSSYPCTSETMCPAPETPSPPTNKVLKCQKIKEPRETCAAVLLKYMLSQKNTDEIDAFFFSLATTVKSFPPCQRAMAKAQIFSIVSNLELEMLTVSTDPGRSSQIPSPGPSSKVLSPGRSSPAPSAGKSSLVPSPGQSSQVSQSTQLNQAVLTGQTTEPGLPILGKQLSASVKTTGSSQQALQGQQSLSKRSSHPSEIYPHGQPSLSAQSTQSSRPIPNGQQSLLAQSIQTNQQALQLLPYGSLADPTGQLSLPGQSSPSRQPTQSNQSMMYLLSDLSPPSCPTTPPNSVCPDLSPTSCSSCYRSSELFCTFPDETCKRDPPENRHTH